MDEEVSPPVSKIDSKSAPLGCSQDILPSGALQLIFVVWGKDAQSSTKDSSRGDVAPGPFLKLFVKAEELETIYGSSKLADILARDCLRPVVRRPKRLTLYWLSDVLEVAVLYRRGDIEVDWKKGKATRRNSPSNTKA